MISREIRELLTLTFLAIIVVIVLTHRAGFATFISALSGGYRTIVGSFITPTKA